MTRVQLPSTTSLSIAQFGRSLEAPGHIIEQLTDERLQAQAPRSIVSDVLPVERWFPGMRVIVERSAAGFTISHRPPVRRMAVASIGSAALLFTTLPIPVGDAILAGRRDCRIAHSVTVAQCPPPPNSTSDPDS